MNFTKIKGDDKPQNIVRLPRLGKIRLGIKKKSMKTGNEYPTETNYFVCPDEVKEVFGDKPTTLNIMIPVEDQSKFLRQYYACYKSNQMIDCIGDGEQAERRANDNEIVECPSPKDCEYGEKRKCTARMDLMIVLPDVNMGGVYQISTGSINSSIDVRSGLEMAKFIYGRTAWVPMQLSRVEKKIKDPSTGKMMTHWPMKLNTVGTISQVTEMKKSLLTSVGDAFMLPEPVIEGPMEDTPIVMVDDRTIEERGGRTKAAQAVMDQTEPEIPDAVDTAEATDETDPNKRKQNDPF